MKDHFALMPIKAMTPSAIKEHHAVRHLETSQRQNRVPVMQNALEAMGGIDTPKQCEAIGRVIQFDATKAAEKLFPERPGLYNKPDVVFEPRKPRHWEPSVVPVMERKVNAHEPGGQGENGGHRFEAGDGTKKNAVVSFV